MTQEELEFRRRCPYDAFGDYSDVLKEIRQKEKEARTQCDMTRVQRYNNLCTLVIFQAYNYAVPPWLILLFPAGNLFPVWNSHLSIP